MNDYATSGRNYGTMFFRAGDEGMDACFGSEKRDPGYGKEFRGKPLRFRPRDERVERAALRVPDALASSQGPGEVSWRP
jgi:hypothetical protein